MNLDDKDELARACQRVSDALGVTLDRALLDAYLLGTDKALLSYEKLQQSPNVIPVIHKYLFAAEAYRRQPALDSYYDIFHATRMVPLLLILDHAITVVRQKVAHAEERIARLGRELKMDAFDAVLFELVTAARYAECPAIKEVAFLQETSHQQPDIRATASNVTLYAECKRFDRSLDATIDIRNVAAGKATIVLHALQYLKLSAVVEIIFKVNPSEVPDEDVARFAGQAVRTSSPIETDRLIVRHRPINIAPFQKPALYPSSMYFADHYGYRTDGEWHGLVHAMQPSWVGPSYLGGVKWEAAVKWRADDSQLVWKQKRLGYSLLFKGLDQLAAPSDATDTVLHVCFERDTPLGPREKELLHFLETLRKQTKHAFGWTIFNELVINASPTGRFDFVENAHILTGPHRSTGQPLVTTVFVPDSAVRDGVGDFGVGLLLPSVDEDVLAGHEESPTATHPGEDPEK